MKIKPLFDRVLLKRKDPETRTASGLYLPEKGQEKSNLAEVVAVGHGRLNKDGTITALTVEAGQTVLLGKWGGDEIEVDGVDLLFVREQDILAVSE